MSGDFTSSGYRRRIRRSGVFGVAVPPSNWERSLHTGEPAEWIAGSRASLKRLPKHVRIVLGYAIRLAETGRRHPDAKSLPPIDTSVTTITSQITGLSSLPVPVMPRQSTPTRRDQVKSNAYDPVSKELAAVSLPEVGSRDRG